MTPPAASCGHITPAFSTLVSATDRAGVLTGSRAALEVHAHDVPFVMDHGQHVCKLTFERMVSEPSKLYGDDIGSNYQGQGDTLSKHFRPRAGRGP